MKQICEIKGCGKIVEQPFIIVGKKVCRQCYEELIVLLEDKKKR